ncbi:MAG TPA: hypothetical protein VF463_00650 [Sphingobium sp.]
MNRYGGQSRDHSRLSTGWASLALRGAGLCLIASVVVEGRALFTLVHIHPADRAIGALLLGMLAFVSASAGTALIMLGRHLFDPITLSPRWTRRGSADQAVIGIRPLPRPEA